jgi:hypothetical protein
MASGDMLAKYFSNYFSKQSPLKHFLLSINGKALFLMKGVFIFETQVYQKL